MKGRTTNTPKTNKMPKAPKPMAKGGMAKKGC
jgi:hypothetical protein